MSFLLVSLEYKKKNKKWLKQSKAHWSQWSAEIRMTFLPCVFGAEHGLEDWVYWGGRTVLGLSSVFSVKGLLMHFKGVLNLKNPPKIKKHILFFNMLNRHPVELRRVKEQPRSWTDRSLLHGRICFSLYLVLHYLYHVLSLGFSLPSLPLSFYRETW